MKTLEWKLADRTGWNAGPWDDEPDKMQWQDEATGLPCLIVRGPIGGLCGYVGVGPTHPWYGVEYSACHIKPKCEDSYCNHSPDNAVECHGGLTFAASCSVATRERWEKWRAYMLSPEHVAQVAQHPQGDSARRQRSMGHLVNDFEAWCRDSEGREICHLTEPGDFEPAWWFGFDCAHAGDAYPRQWSFTNDPYLARHETYKDIAYVRAEITRLAQQIAAHATPAAL